jgi:hypothetical protein
MDRPAPKATAATEISRGENAATTTHGGLISLAAARTKVGPTRAAEKEDLNSALIVAGQTSARPVRMVNRPHEEARIVVQATMIRQDHGDRNAPTRPHRVRRLRVTGPPPDAALPSVRSRNPSMIATGDTGGFVRPCSFMSSHRTSRGVAGL